jgi:L-aminopeptidase/D-esterase-like protein
VAPGARPTIRDVPGIEVGHTTDPVGVTGCTVILAADGAVAGVDVRGGAPGTRETDLLRPTATVERIHAVCLCGGSAFGLAAADGVMRWLAERGIGFPTGIRPVPIVPAACLFDLGIGSPEAAPGPADGYAAAAAARDGTGVLEGSVGAGTGATVAKLAGPERAHKGGVGSAAGQLDDGAWVGTLAVTNALGAVYARDGRLLTPTVETGEGRLPGSTTPAPWSPAPPAPGIQTTLAVIATDAPLDRAQCRSLAGLGHDALARSVRPVHTPYDGDTVFALSTAVGEPVGPGRFTQLGMLAVELLCEAIERSVLLAAPPGGVPAADHTPGRDRRPAGRPRGGP